MLSTVCISASVIMIFSSLSFITSKDYILNELYSKRIKYDAEIFFSEKPDPEFIDTLKNKNYIKEIKLLSYSDETIEFNDKQESVLINTIEDNNTDLVYIYDSNHNKLNIPSDGIIIEKHTADRLNIKVGDKVSIRDNLVEVKEISNESINRIQYLSDNKKEIIKDGLSALLIKYDNNKKTDLLSYLSQNDKYIYTLFTDLSYENNLEIFKTYNLAAYIIIGFAIIIGLIIVINTNLTNLLEQKKKLCMLKSFGFQYSEISSHWFINVFIQFICACLIGFPFGGMIARLTLNQLTTFNREYIYANGIMEYLITFILVFIYIVISHLISMNILKKWNITEIIKEKE